MLKQFNNNNSNTSLIQAATRASHSDSGSDKDDLIPQDLSDLSPTLNYKDRKSVV